MSDERLVCFHGPPHEVDIFHLYSDESGVRRHAGCWLASDIRIVSDPRLEVVPLLRNVIAEQRMAETTKRLEAGYAPVPGPT